MKTTFTKNLLLVVFAFFVYSSASAQTPFWTEDFGSVTDLPAGWTTADASGGSAAWAWCGDPTSTNNCIVNWAAYNNQHDMAFFSTSGEGHLYMDSDALGNVVPNHEAQLTTTAIDCSGQSEVWLKMESLIGVFTLDAVDNAILRVSTDNANWTDYTIFEGLTTTERWSGNPEISLINISDVAAGSATVYIQWQWIGNYEYYWLMDDLELYPEDPTSLFIAAHDMRVNDNFFAIAWNAQWPGSQIGTFGFLADIENVGFADQTGVNLNVSIVDDATSAVVYTEDLDYGTIMSDSLAENVLFAGAGFTPSMTPGTTYTGTYTVTADSTDLLPDNNTQTFDFAITDTLFAKEQGASRFISPAASNWDDGEPHSWAYGNCFYMPNGNGLYARYAQFTVGNAADVAGRLLTVTLYTWDEDTNLDGNADPDERTAIGQNFYEITGAELDTDILTLPLFVNGSLGEIPLNDDTYYIIMLEYTSADIVDFVMMGSEDYDYSASAFRTEELGTGARYGSMLGVNGDLSTEPYSSVGFGRDIVPVVRLSIGTDPIMEGDATSDILSDDNVVTVTPNPAESYINLNLDLVEAHDNAIVRIMDVSGKVITERAYENVLNETFQYNVSNLASGTYFLHFITEEGSKAVRFVVSK